MGLWGAAQAIAFGLGGLVGTGASDLAHWLVGSPGAAYSWVFGFEALLFVASAALAWGVRDAQQPIATKRSTPARALPDWIAGESHGAA